MGETEQVTDLVAGNVQLGIPTMPAALGFIQAGRVKALGVSTAKRTAVLPDIPSLQEAGVPTYDTALWTAVLVPTGTPKDIVSRLHGEVAKVLELQDVRDALAKQGAQAQSSTPEQLGAYMRTELAQWAKVVKASGAKAD